MTFDELIETRRSVREFVASEIDAAEVAAIVEAALNAPSWKNTEVTRYYAATSAAAKARLWGEALPAFNVGSSANAAALVAVSFKKGESGYMGTEPANELGDMWGAYDCGIASAYFVLAAKRRGWDSLIMGIRDEAKVRECFGIPADEIITAVIALGRSDKPGHKYPRKPVAEVLQCR